VLAVTWNVGESKPEAGSPFFRWVHEAAANMQLAVVALQEIEMGSSSGGQGVWSMGGEGPHGCGVGRVRPPQAVVAGRV
jgi:hypothetical protein